MGIKEFSKERRTDIHKEYGGMIILSVSKVEWSLKATPKTESRRQDIAKDRAA
jgi:hypothetical protein